MQPRLTHREVLHSPAVSSLTLSPAAHVHGFPTVHQMTYQTFTTTSHNKFLLTANQHGGVTVRALDSQSSGSGWTPGRSTVM